MPADPTPAPADRTSGDRADDTSLDETITAAVAADSVPEAVVQAARDAGAVPVYADLEDTIATAVAKDSVPDAVVQGARDVYRKARGAPV
jgi:hypothetical protein